MNPALQPADGLTHLHHAYLQSSHTARLGRNRAALHLTIWLTAPDVVNAALTALYDATRRPEDAARSKYALTHTVRTHLGCDDDAYLCEGYGEDKEGFRGGFMRKNVIEVAQRALELNVAALAKELTPLPVKVESLLGLF